MSKATKTRSNRPGWSVTFTHPRKRNSRGKLGQKVRRGLGTSDTAEADDLVAQLNELLSDEYWWSVDRRVEAEKRFAPVVVSTFFDGMESGRVSYKSLREERIPLPTRDDGYARIMFVGTTGAGKTTLLRQIIGSDHEEDRFPSTSTARTTTADIEIITDDGPFEAVVTFMQEAEVRAHVEECLEDAALAAVQSKKDEKIASELLSHREQRFRLSYILGAWRAKSEAFAEDDFSFEEDEPEHEQLDEDEAVSATERARNQERLEQFVDRIKKLAGATADEIAKAIGPLKNQENPEDRGTWLELFTDSLVETEEFHSLALDIMDDVERRFRFVEAGDYHYGPTDWPLSWSFQETDRSEFLKQVRGFSSNHHAQFGRLLTPLVNGMRVRGPLKPEHSELQVADKLVLLDGEGLGHTARSATSVSTQVTRRFAEAEMILLVDNAESPMLAAPMELIRSVGSSGHADKLAVAFTHFDEVKGDNLKTFQEKRDHVMGSVGNAIGGLRQSLGTSVTAALERQLEENAFFLGALDKPVSKIPPGVIKQIRQLMERMQAAAEPEEPTEVAPRYHMEGLELALRDAVEGFHGPWRARLGLDYHDGISKEHWTRVKALSRRFANGWQVEYDTLRPVADLVARLQENISYWLDSPSDWTRTPETEEEREAALANVRREVFSALHDVAERRLADDHRVDWVQAFSFSGTGSTFRRSEEIDRIYQEAAPVISSAMSSPARSFLHDLHKIVRDAVTGAGGHIDAEAAA